MKIIIISRYFKNLFILHLSLILFAKVSQTNPINQDEVEVEIANEISDDEENIDDSGFTTIKNENVEHELPPITFKPNENETSALNGTRIYNGSRANGRYPFMVAILDVSGGLICGGALINNQHVLTAAHCVDAIKGTRAQFWVGASNLANQFELNVVKLSWIEVRAGNFNPTTLRDDIAIFRLSAPIFISSFNPYPAPACIGPSFYQMQPVALIGFGADINMRPTTYLQFASGQTLPNNQCNRNDIGVGQVCARIYNDNGGLAEQNNGDSGGPLFFRNNNLNKYVLVGLVSFNVKENVSRNPVFAYPGVYTRTSEYTNFIRNFAGNIDTNC